MRNLAVEKVTIFFFLQTTILLETIRRYLMPKITTKYRFILRFVVSIIIMVTKRANHLV